MRTIGTIVEVRPSRQEGMSHYNMRCSEIPGNPIGCGFVAPTGKYEVGDTVYDDETAPKVYAGKWDKDGKALY